MIIYPARRGNPDHDHVTCVTCVISITIAYTRTEPVCAWCSEPDLSHIERALSGQAVSIPDAAGEQILNTVASKIKATPKFLLLLVCTVLKCGFFLFPEQFQEIVFEAEADEEAGTSNGNMSKVADASALNLNCKGLALPFIDGAQPPDDPPDATGDNNLVHEKMLVKRGFPKRPPVNIRFEDVTFDAWQFSLSECGRSKWFFLCSVYAFLNLNNIMNYL